jgi:hypothetical protein
MKPNEERIKFFLDKDIKSLADRTPQRLRRGPSDRRLTAPHVLDRCNANPGLIYRREDEAPAGGTPAGASGTP